MAALRGGLRALGAELSAKARSRQFWRLSRKGFPLVLPMLGKPGSLRADYSADFLHTLVTDRVRNDAFREAIARSRAKQVLEVGCGPWLPLTDMALESGAERVVAIEACPAHAAEARRRAAGRPVTVLEGRSADARLPEGFAPDLVVGELLGYFASEEGAPAIFAELQRRLGAPLRVVPSSACSMVAPVRPLELSLRQRCRNWWAHGVWPSLQPGRLYDCRNFPLGLELAAPQAWERFDFGSPALQEQLQQRAALRFRVAPGEAVGGLLFWLRAQVDEHSTIDTRDSATHWNSYYLHLPPRPVGPEGEVIVHTHVDARSEEVEYEFRVGSFVYATRDL